MSPNMEGWKRSVETAMDEYRAELIEAASDGAADGRGVVSEVECALFPHCTLPSGHAGWCLRPQPASGGPAVDRQVIDEQAVDAALRQVIAHLDYDTHKYLECDEETGEDTYPEHVARFVAAYTAALAEQSKECDK